MRIAFAVVTLALLAGVVVGREKPAEVLFQERKAADSRDFDVSALERKTAAAPAADPFARRSFGAPAEAVAAAPQKPQAPGLPFRYMGKVTEDGKTEILLLRGDEHFAVSAGQKFDPEYRLDKVTSTALTFTYLPLKTKQTLELAP